MIGCLEWAAAINSFSSLPLPVASACPALLQLSGRGAKVLPRYVVAGLVPLCLLAALVIDRAGEVPAVLLSSSNPALQAAADLERAGEGRFRLYPTLPCVH